MSDNNELDPKIETGKIAEIEQEPKKKSRSYYVKQAEKTKRKVKVLELSLKGLEPAVIARATMQDVSTVNRTLTQFKGVFKELENVKEFQVNKGALLDAATLAFLKKALSEKALDKCGSNHLAFAAKTTFDMGRLERGQSTANIAHCHFTKVNPTDLEGEL